MEFELSQQAYTTFAQFLQHKLGIVLGDNRQYLVKSRLSALARDCQYSDINVFLQDVVNVKNSRLTDQCLELMTTNETFWFRDQYPFSLLEKCILPALHQQQKKLRIWSSACASGQEAYSTAIQVCEFQQAHPGAFSAGVEIVGTDFSSKMVEHAQQGLYDELALSRGLSNHLKQKYFVEFDNKKMHVDNKLKAITKFRRFNLLGDYSALGKFDIVFCRNVLIYFNGNEKAKILNKIAACLPNNGTLFLGAAESINVTEQLFKMQTKQQGLYYSKL